MSNRSRLIESLAIWGIVIGTISLLYHLPMGWIRQNLSVWIAILLIYVPIIVFKIRKEPFHFFEKNLPELFRSLKTVIFFSLIVLPPVVLLNHLFQENFLRTEYHSASNHSLWSIFVFHFLIVALPEEFFFRGYLFTRMEQICKNLKGFYLFKVKIDFGFVFLAFLFAISHSLIVFQIWHATIFFPALAFGWLRARTGSLTAPIIFHAVCNLFVAWIALHYR